MHFIGIDLHKHIFTVCVLNDNEKIVDELIDIETSEGGGLDHLMSRYPSDDCVILFENLTRAHFAFHYLYEHIYTVHVAHTGHGALRSITNTNLKTDKIDAYKFALVCKDLYAGRRFIRRTHTSSDENMRMKATIRLCNRYSSECEEMKLRIMEYMNLHNIPEHPRYKEVTGQKYMRCLLELGDPVLTSMVNFMIALKGQIDALMREIDGFADRSENVRLLVSIKGIGSLTAVTVVTAINGVHRFDSPEKLVLYFGLVVCTSKSAGVRKN